MRVPSLLVVVVVVAERPLAGEHYSEAVAVLVVKVAQQLLQHSD